VIDGTKWSGIIIYGHGEMGIGLGQDDIDLLRNILIKNVEIFDNGWRNSGGDWGPESDGSGVDLSGTRITFQRAIIHDNGQDAFQSGGGIADFTIRESWLFNQRAHPDQEAHPGEPFNGGTHSDGIQVYDGGTQSGFVIEDSIIGPGFMQGIIFSDNAIIKDVIIRNSLFVGYHGDNSNAGILSLSSNSSPTDYYLDNVTIFQDPGRLYWNILIQGSDHVVTNSIFFGGESLSVQGNPDVGNNIYWQINKPQPDIGEESDPEFVDMDFSGVGVEFADFDFASQTHPNKGSRITSADDLLNGEYQ
jgi:hypothetical protein